MPIKGHIYTHTHKTRPATARSGPMLNFPRIHFPLKLSRSIRNKQKNRTNNDDGQSELGLVLAQIYFRLLIGSAEDVVGMAIWHSIHTKIDCWIYVNTNCAIMRGHERIPNEIVLLINFVAVLFLCVATKCLICNVRAGTPCAEQTHENARKEIYYRRISRGFPASMRRLLRSSFVAWSHNAWTIG